MPNSERTPREGVDEYGRTPIWEAAFTGDLATLKQLVEAGGDVNQQDKLGFSPLHIAAQERRANVIDYLLTRNANPNVIDRHGNNPLWTAIMNARGEYQIVTALLNAGSNVTLKNKHDKSIFDLVSTIGGELLILVSKYMK